MSVNQPDLLCISHLRWNFVYQRPQHLMSRAAKHRRVFFVEEPIFDAKIAKLDVSRDASGVQVVVPHLPAELSETEAHVQLGSLLQQMLAHNNTKDYHLWFYTPMPLPALTHLASSKAPGLVIYDCMDELANFRFAPSSLREREAQLFAWADLVFTGGHSLYETKRLQHHTVHAFPSSVDVRHFAKARGPLAQPDDLKAIPKPRIGYIGVIDERMDLELLEAIARTCPQWHYVMLGPIVKISNDDLPKYPNIHYLGQKAYEALPSYLAHLDVAMMPFALNESTRYISPTKTPEYLAAGKPVVSTPIGDVVRPYGEKDLVMIAKDATAFCDAIAQLLSGNEERRLRADSFVGQMSWDRTWARMDEVMQHVVSLRQPLNTLKKSRYPLPKQLSLPPVSSVAKTSQSSALRNSQG